MAKRRAFGKTWWAKKWIEALEILGRDYSNRLPRGRTYARRGAVKDLVVTPGEVIAKVQGTRLTPYKVKIKIKALTDKQWQKVIKVLAGQAIFAAKLLTGEMPSNIDEAFNRCGLSLFPAKASELKTSCSCPDWANPCKHIAATHYILAEAFDRDPFLLFELRGWTKEKVLEELREARSLQDSGEKETLEKVLIDDLDEKEFTALRDSLEDLHFHIAEPKEKFAILKKLGPLSDEAESRLIVSFLEQIYRDASQIAYEIALAFPIKKGRK
ncbi:MAG: SWIM zinc finger family protein [Candidatus Aerophobetes bacterium]|nr:SWIM zinc finger family protein [Candidatus Aerophobetes bacterium]